MTWRNCSGVSRVAGTAVPTPALFTRMSTRPNSAIAASTSAWQSSGRATSVRTDSARRPAVSTAFSVSASRSTRRAPSTTSAPASARARANTTPRPEDAPVTTATRPSSRNMSRIVLSLTGGSRSSVHQWPVVPRTVAKTWGRSPSGRVGPPDQRHNREDRNVSNLGQNLLDTAARDEAHPAIRMDDAVLTFGEFRDAALKVAAGLGARGVQPGDRVGMVLPNVPSFPVVFYGALLAGAAVVPMNPLLKAREVEYYLRDSGARIVVALASSADAVEEAAGTVGIDAVTVAPALPEELMAGEALDGAVERADDD